MCGYSRNIYLFHKSIMQTLKKGMWGKQSQWLGGDKGLVVVATFYDLKHKNDFQGRISLALPLI
jgi:hypothetical protein